VPVIESALSCIQRARLNLCTPLPGGMLVAQPKPAEKNTMKKTILALLALLLSFTFSACVSVGYSSRGGWFVWPGGCGLIVIILLILFLSRRRR